MKHLLIYIFCFQFLTTIGSCQKPSIEPPIIIDTFPTKLAVLWNADFHSDGEGDFFWDYEMANNQYIVLANIYDSDGGKPRGIGVYDKLTGERHPAWKNDPCCIFALGELEYLRNCKIAGKDKDIILIYSGQELFAYGLHSGQRMWKLSIPNKGAVKISENEDYAFVNYGLSKSWYSLAMIDVYSGKKTDILTLYAEDNYEFEINPPSAYVSGDGDTLLFFSTSGWNFATIDGRVCVYCYNLTKKQMLWENKQFTIDTDVSAFQPPPFVIENDKLIVTSLRAIHCFNKNTGELLWQKESLGFADKPPLYYEGKLYIRSGNPCTLFCLDAQSGQQIWENTILNPYPAFDGRMAIYKDRLYFSMSNGDATYHLECVDIHTGQELWRDRGPYGCVAFGVLIDPQTGYLYCNTGWSTMCIDLNKTPK
jgi:outer membrane protein assembly factor BamB